MKKFIVLLTGILLVLTGCTQQAKNQTVNVYSLNGPTSMAIAKMLSDNDSLYQKNIVSDASLISSAVTKSEADIAILPANLAYNLYTKTSDFKVVAITTLNVLYLVSTDKEVTDFNSLKGKTVFLSGQGTTPELVVNYLLENSNLQSDVELVFKSSANEVALAVSSGLCDTAILPQPFVTVALSKNPDLTIVMDLSQQWQTVNNNCEIITAVAIVKNDFIENYPEQFAQFLTDLNDSVNWINTNHQEGAQLIVELGILNDINIAKEAIAYCGLTYIDNNEMKASLNNYLNTLYGVTADENFFYIEN
ncbi:MAG: ABC transporter substrate-binding protein [Erysipelotrichaceae bacterium]